MYRIQSHTKAEQEGEDHAVSNVLPSWLSLAEDINVPIDVGHGRSHRLLPFRKQQPPYFPLNTSRTATRSSPGRFPTARFYAPCKPFTKNFTAGGKGST